MIADFANGEISQASSLFDCNITIEKYKASSGSVPRDRPCDLSSLASQHLFLPA